MNISKYIKENQILSIAGPTAAGKSALALKLAQAHLKTSPSATIHLLSADSRQVYQGLTTLTGADIPHEWLQHKLPFLDYQSYQAPTQAIYLHAVDIIPVTQVWSAAHLHHLFTQIRAQLRKQDRLIVVGGTGFYHRQLMQPAASLHIPPNPALRRQLEQLPLAKLQEQLRTLQPNKFEAMNHSDQHNPRRLIRALELAKQGEVTPTPSGQTPAWPTIYLDLPLEQVRAAIAKRVIDRLPRAKAEVAPIIQDQALTKQLTKHLAHSSTGFQQLAALIRGEIDLEQAVSDWTTSEYQYAKRQITWWKTNPHLIRVGVVHY